MQIRVADQYNVHQHTTIQDYSRTKGEKDKTSYETGALITKLGSVYL